MASFSRPVYSSNGAKGHYHTAKDDDVLVDTDTANSQVPHVHVYKVNNFIYYTPEGYGEGHSHGNVLELATKPTEYDVPLKRRHRKPFVIGEKLD